MNRRKQMMVMQKRSSILQRILSTRPDNLLAYWPLSESTGTVAAVSRCVAGQMLFNTGFENAGTGGADVFADWTETATDGAIADEASVVHGGSHAVKITAGPTRNTRIAQNFVSVPGKTYVLNVWCRGDGTNQGRIVIRDNTAAANIVAMNTGVAGTTYTLVTYSFAAPANCVSVSIQLYNPLVEAALCYFDDCTVDIAASEKPYDGIVSGATVGQVVDGIPCFSFDGTNDFVNLGTPSLVNGFNGAEGTMVIWARVSAAAEWTDGADRYLYRFKTSDLSDAVTFGKYNAANTVFWQYNCNGTNQLYTKGSISTTGWFTLGITWSASGGVVQPYYNGEAGDDPAAPGSPWDGRLTTKALIGGEDTGTPTDSWKGYAAHAVLWNAALTPAEMYKFR